MNPGQTHFHPPAASDDEATARLFLYAIPPPYSLNWSTPSKLMRGVAKNFLKRQIDPNSHYIGHINVGLQMDENSEPIAFGQTSNKDFSYHFKVLTNQMDASALVTEPQPGREVGFEEARNEHEERYKDGSVRILSFKISQNTAAFLQDYYLSYQARKMHLQFGTMESDPLKGEPAGCAAFGLAYLRLAGVMEEEFYEQWQREICFPDQLLNIDRPGFWSLILNDKWDWAKPEDPGSRPMQLWDPEKIIKWFDRLWEQENWIRPCDKSHVDQARKIEIDRRDAPLMGQLDPYRIRFIKDFYGISKDAIVRDRVRKLKKMAVY